MDRRRFVICIFNNGNCVGLVKSVSYTRNKFLGTNDKRNAKVFVGEYRVQSEIDRLVRYFGKYASFGYQQI